MENFFIAGGFRMPTYAPKSEEEKKFDPTRMKNLAEAELQARETLMVLPAEIQVLYEKQLKMLSDEVDRLIKAQD